MKSVRLDPELEARLKRAADVSARRESEIIREAIRRYCAELLGRRLDHRLGDLVGSVASGGGDSWRTGRAFSALLQKRGRRRRRATRR